MVRFAIISFLIVGVCLILLFLAYKEIVIPCVFNKLTGLKCSGCGNTRAVIMISKLDFKGAFLQNPLFILELGYIVWVYLKSGWEYIKNGQFRYKSPSISIDLSVLVVIVLWGIVRNFLSI